MDVNNYNDFVENGFDFVAGCKMDASNFVAAGIGSDIDWNSKNHAYFEHRWLLKSPESLGN